MANGKITLQDSVSGFGTTLQSGTLSGDVVHTLPSTSSNLAPLESPIFAGEPKVPTAPAGTNTTQVATTAFVMQNGVPSGAIILWSGAVGSIPDGWYLCNGANGTPNLQDRFIIGAGSGYAVGATGGSKDAIAVSHTHTFSGSGTTSTAGNHSHTNNRISSDFGSVGGIVAVPAGTNGNGVVYSGSSYWSTTSAGDHSHTMSVSGTTNTTGSDGKNANLPPYYALAYIMKS